MLRSAVLKRARTTGSRLSAPGPSIRNQSTGSGSGGGGKLGKVLLGLTAAGAGTLGYAKVNPAFAKTLKDNVPGIEPVLTALGCDTSGGKPISSVISAFPSSAPPPISIGVPQPPIPSFTSSKSSDSESPSLLKVKKTIDAVKDSKEILETKKPVKGVETGKPAHDAKEDELRRQKQNFILEQALRDATTSAERAAVDAASELENAADRTEEYAVKLMRALDEAAGAEDHHMWQAANEAKVGQTAAQKIANAKATDAAKALQRLQDAIQKGRSDPATADNMNLEQAEQTLTKLRDRVSSASARVSKQLESLNLAQRFSSAIEESKKQLIEEVSAILPPGKSLADPKKLTLDDMNLLIVHAHKKIETLNKELSRMQLSDDEKAKQFRQQLASLDKEVSRQKSEVAKMVALRVNEEREAFEVELQNQLRRQVGVHTDHLKEALEEQRAELLRNRQMDIEKAREEERSLQVARLGEAVQLLQKMEAYLHSRKVLDEASKKAKSLWLSCASLKHVLAQGRGNKNEPQSLSADIVPLREVSEASEFVKAVLSAIPEQALKRGVYPETTLKERFYKVETTCRRLALMEDQNGGGVGRHLLSYLMSMFMIYPKPVPQEELNKEQKVNPLMWDTFDILSRVRASLQGDDLEQALRYANQLKGQPRQAAKDWISEVRLLLETRQAANALMAYAAATVAEDLPK